MEEEIIKEEPTSTPEIKQETEKKEHKKIAIKVNVKTIVIVVIIIVLGVLAYFSRSLFVAATVDGISISRLSLISKLEKASGKSLLDSVITEKLIQNEAKAKKIVVSDEDVNTQIKTIEDQISAQGSTINEALNTQGMSMDDLKKQIILQKQVEKLIGDKVVITEQEIAKYITDNEIEVQSGQEAMINEQVRNQLMNDKFSTEVEALISDLKAKAKIKYFVKY
ncbi:MAG: SurA N-terminal domain-containing protein [Patescibacteria group bacterium]|nr:SurA N-terminal domain-containing protein [Patescibacteria group bacterium]MDD4304490.1 SurA N-terminal domain-containing protein [Patescibacteria group bacterium]MDD4694850.1 SurA N-terminal domain-containing protein [Patescibacteria group bacterium]